MRIHLSHCVQSAVDPSPHVLEVASMFGLGIDQDKQIQLVPPTDLELRPGQVVFITGASGSGKSTVIRLVRRELEQNEGVYLLYFDSLPPIDDRPLVDCFPARPLGQVLRLLSLAGLNDAFVMLRKPSQLSDGQRYRLRLAQAMAMIEEDVIPGRLRVVLADEFGATLDRVTAKVIARNVRRWASAQGICFVVATTHDDLLEPLDPDILIEKHLGESMDVLQRPGR
jgi:uncharacterized protein